MNEVYQRCLIFRVWNTKTKKWIHEGINLFGETILLGAFMSKISIHELNDCIAQQFIGMSDKDGKLIYEGDIVKYDTDNKEENKTYKNLLTSKVYYDNAKWRIRYSADTYNWNNMKVLGNIFENLELIKNKI